MTGTGRRAEEPRASAGLRRGLLAGVALAAAVASGFAWQGEPAGGPARNPARSAEAAAVAEGAWLFEVKGCAACHRAQERGYPDLAGAAEWAADRQEGMTAEDYLAESILDPAAAISPEITPESTLTMPRLNVTDEEVDALVAYLLEH